MHTARTRRPKEADLARYRQNDWEITESNFQFIGHRRVRKDSLVVTGNAGEKGLILGKSNINEVSKTSAACYQVVAVATGGCPPSEDVPEVVELRAILGLIVTLPSL